MKESTQPVSALSNEKPIELEMLHSVLTDETTYPWNPYAPTTEQYLQQLETAFEPGELSEDVFCSQWSQLTQQAEQLWASSPSALAAKLIQQFESRMPAQLLTRLAANAQQAVKSGYTAINQLVDCVQDVLEGWEADDLQVMARPLAMAMRDGHGEILDVTLRSVPQTDWDKLSEIEQARLSLAIARYALDELAQGEDA